MKRILYFFVIATLVALISGCVDNMQPQPVPEVPGTYFFSVKANKADALTKALAVDGNTIAATWASGESVDVFLGDNNVGTLTATDGFGTSIATLSGNISNTVEATNTLILKFKSSNYNNQDGTLESIAANCDFATASVMVDHIDGNTAYPSSNASFTNQQAIVKFTLQDDLANSINATSLTLTHGEKTISLSIPATTYSTNGDGVVFVAIPGFSAEKLSLTAIANEKTYIFEKQEATFTDGTYTRVLVRMFNERVTPLTLEAAVAGAKVAFSQATSNSYFLFGEDVQYSTDGSTWNTYTSGEQITLEKVGDKVMFRGRKAQYNAGSANGYHAQFTCSAGCYLYGNMMSLFGDSSFEYETNTAFVFGNAHSLMGIFRGNTQIKNHGYKTISLPATKLYEECYANMFEGCTGLTSAPVLPAETLQEGCYHDMFRGCTGLKSAPKLPAKTMKNNCYGSMFWGCTGLTEAPELPATTLDSNCYSYMFYGCTGLSSTPALPVETAPSRCYINMFYGCTGLTSTPDLPATTLGNSCYQSMFEGCTGLTSVSTLPASEMKNYCYSHMFKGCTKLETAPALPATTLAASCYESMFEGCIKLEKAPTLPATSLAATCYKNMFKGCSRLSFVTCRAASIPEDCTKDWLSGVNSPGTLISPVTTWAVGPSGIPSGWINALSTPLTIEAKKASYVRLRPGYEIVFGENVEYSLDGSSWNTYDPYNNSVIDLSVGSKVMFRGALAAYASSESYYSYFEMSDDCYVYGNIMSLVNKTDYASQTALTADHAFTGLFTNCAHLLSDFRLLVLPATTLSKGCYERMFYGCTGLSVAPELPATTLKESCYNRMFNDCSSLRAVTCLATDHTATECTNSWLYGVNIAGTFTAPAAAVWSSDPSGIPVTWKRVVNN